MTEEHLAPAGSGSPDEGQNGAIRSRTPTQPDRTSKANECSSESECQIFTAREQSDPVVERQPAAPDGGWGWVVLIATILVLALTLAFPSCIGIFYTDLQTDFEATNSETSWVPSIMTAVLHAGGPLCSVLVEHYGCRVTVMIGGILSGFGMAASCFTRSIGQLYITAGIITGMGFCLSFQPAVTILGHYFVRRRAFANAMSSTGTAIGLSVWPLFAQVLLSHMGWRGSFLILGGVLLNCCVCGAVMRPVSPRQEQKGRRLDKSPRDMPGQKDTSEKKMDLNQILNKKFKVFLSALQKHMAFDLFCANKRYQTYTIGITWMMLGFIVPLIYVVPYATSEGMEQSKAALLLAILGFINIFMRPLSGLIFGLSYFSGKHIYIFTAAVVVNGLSNCICCISADFLVLVAYCVVYGLSMSIIGSILFTVLMDIVEMRRFPSALGLLTIMESVTLLIGPPLAGYLVDRTQKYTYVFYASSAAVVSAGLFLWVSAWLLDREEGRAKDNEKCSDPLSPDCRYTGMERRTSSKQNSTEMVYITSV
ncbi:MOT6 protein, partial [Atractosteus spatula]|nr:MOT6 protein [Atractosteus spatula]